MTVQLDAFQVLADPTRRGIVQALREGERQVNGVVEQAGVHQSGVSRHLRILLETGFVSVRPAGQRRFYALKPERFRELDRWLAQYRGLWEARLDRFGEALEEKRRAGETPAPPAGQVESPQVGQVESLQVGQASRLPGCQQKARKPKPKGRTR